AFVSVDSDRSRAYDSSFAPASVIFASESESVSAGLNYLVLHESPSFPEVVVGGSVVQSDSEGRETDGQGLSISFTRTLPSTSLNGSASLFRSKTDGFKPGYSRSLSFSYSLIMNHDLTAGVGYSLSKPNASVSSSSGFTSLYYRFWKDWVMNLSASQAFDESNSTFFSLGITHTLRQ
ncbi:MAG: hypothetical protein R3194_10535, partial [Limnobacter sp.]|nr:hypothetical protein [Limnobacter sp.]